MSSQDLLDERSFDFPYHLCVNIHGSDVDIDGSDADIEIDSESDTESKNKHKFKMDTRSDIDSSDSCSDSDDKSTSDQTASESDENEIEYNISLEDSMMEYFDMTNGKCESCFDKEGLFIFENNNSGHSEESEIKCEIESEASPSPLSIGKVFCIKCETCVICNDHHLPQMKLCISCFCSDCGHLKSDAHIKNMFFKDSEKCVCDRPRSVDLTENLSHTLDKILCFDQSRTVFQNKNVGFSDMQQINLSRRVIYYSDNGIDDTILERNIALRQQQTKTLIDLSAQYQISGGSERIRKRSTFTKLFDGSGCSSNTTHLDRVSSKLTREGGIETDDSSVDYI